MQVHDAATAPALQCCLGLSVVDLELAPAKAHSLKPLAAAPGSSQLCEALAVEMKDPHQRCSRQPRRARSEQDAVGARSLEGQQRLHHHRVVVQPAIGGAALSIAYSPLTW